MGAFAVARRPDLYATYVGIGQNVNIRKNQALLHEFVKKRALKEGNKDVIRRLEGPVRCRCAAWNGLMH